MRWIRTLICRLLALALTMAAGSPEAAALAVLGPSTPRKPADRLQEDARRLGPLLIPDEDEDL